MKRNILNTLLVSSALLVVVMTGARAMDEISRAGRTIGLVVDDSDQTLAIASVEPGLPADRAGLQPGDIIVSLGGAPTNTLQELYGAASNLAKGKIVEMETLRSEHVRTVQIIPGAPLPWSRLLLELLAILGYTAVAFLARFRAPDGLPARLLTYFSIAVALELSLPNSSTLLSNWLLFRDIFFYLLTGLQLGLELHLASVIPKSYSWFNDRPWLSRLYYVIGLSGGGLAAVTSIAEYFGIEGLAGSFGPSSAALINGLLSLWGLAVVGILLIQYSKSTTPGNRNQALLILIGVVPWAIYNVLTSLTSTTNLTFGVWFELAQPLVLLFYPAVIFIAIFRYHLFDIRVVVKRSLVIVLVTIAVLALFTAVFETLSSRFGRIEQAGQFQVALFALAMLLLGLLFNPVRRLIQQFIDSRFYPEKIAQRERLAELAANLPSLGNLGAIGRQVVEEVRRVFQVTSTTLLVSDPASGLLVSLATASDQPQSDREVSLLLESSDSGIDQIRRAKRPLPADIIANTSPALAQRINALGAETGVGLVNGETLVGLLLLGPKTNRGELTTEEQGLLRLFSLNVAAVLENVRLFQSATYEQLTGLLRREAILEALEIEINRASRYDRPLTVGMIDLDHFKEVNDTWGHLAGDVVLQRVAAELKTALRSTDQIGRYGGEEFLFFLPETDLEQGIQVSEKLRLALEEMPSPVDEAPELRVTASIGITELLAGRHSALSVDAIIREADGALLDGKEAGRNCVFVANSHDGTGE